MDMAAWNSHVAVTWRAQHLNTAYQPNPPAPATSSVSCLNFAYRCLKWGCTGAGWLLLSFSCRPCRCRNNKEKAEKARAVARNMEALLSTLGMDFICCARIDALLPAVS